MARYTFGGGSEDFIYVPVNAGGAQFVALKSGATVTCWNAPSGGTQYTDLLLNGVGVTSIPASGSQIPAFQGPDGVTVMWLDAGAGRAEFYAYNLPVTNLASWQPNLPYVTGQILLAPDGTTLSRNSNGTSRSSFDSTEQAAWSVVATKTGTLEQIAQSATYVAFPPGSVADYAVATRLTAGTNGFQWTTKEELIARALGWAIATDARYSGGAKGDGSTDDSTAINAALSSGARVVWLPQPSVSYKVNSTLLVPTNTSLHGPGGGGQGGSTQCQIVWGGTAGGTIMGPSNRTINAFNFGLKGVELNGGTTAGICLDLYRTSWSRIQDVSAVTTYAGGIGYNLDATSGQCYFNVLDGVKADSCPIGFSFKNGANVNRVTGGSAINCGTSVQFLSASSDNLLLGVDMEVASVQHVLADAPGNSIIGCHFENAPIGLNITANGTDTYRAGNSFATTVTTWVQDATLFGRSLDMYSGTGGTSTDLFQVGSFYCQNSLNTTLTQSYFDQKSWLTQPPVQNAATTAASGGTIPANTYYLKITGTSILGETIASNEVTITTTGSTSTITANWATSTGCTGYRVYVGTSSGGENVYAVAAGAGTVTLTLTSVPGTSGTPPGASTAGSASNIVFNWFRNTATSGTRQVNWYKGDGTSTRAVWWDLGNFNMSLGEIGTATGLRGGLAMANRAAPPTAAPTLGPSLYAENGAGRLITTNNTTVTYAGDVTSVSGNYTVATNDKTILVTTGASTATMTLPTPYKGFDVTVKKVDSGAGAVAFSANVDGAALTLPSQYNFARIVSDGTNFYLIGH